MTGISPANWSWALGAACQFQHLPFDEDLLRHRFPPPYTVESLCACLTELGLRNSLGSVDSAGLRRLSFPCFLAMVPVADDAPVVLVIALGCDEQCILLLSQGDASPQEVPLDTLMPCFGGQALQFMPDTRQVEDPDREDKPGFGFRWFIPELLKHRKIWRDVLLASLAIQLVGLATPLFTQVIIDKVVVHQTMSTLAVVGIGLLVFMVFTAVMTWVRQYLVLHTGNRVDAVLGSQVFEHLLDLSPRYFEHRPTGILTARLHGVETIREFVSGAAVTLLLDLPFLFIFLAVMFFYSWQLSLIALGLLGAVALLSLLVAPVFRTRLNGQFLVGARNQAFITEYLAGIETVKSLQMEPQLKQRYGNFLAEYLAASFGTRQLANSYNVTANALEQVMTLSILCVGAWLVMRNDGFTVGMLVAFQMFAGRLSQPVLRLVGLWQEFQQAGIAVKRLGDILDAPREPVSLIPQRAGNASGKIEIENIAFRYSAERPWLYRDLSLTIKPGKCVALMGPSGSGKSTLARLLQGFVFADEGRIRIDGCDLRLLSANELRSHYGVVPQETMLFSGTLYDNLILANPQAGFEQVVQACRWAEIHDTIEQLPQGYQTEVGERGVGLSGGQKQRIAIARALLKQPRILIFDEATANLDHATAEHFAQTVNRFKGQVTMLFITHQLPKGLQVDEVVMLGGRGADSGAADAQKPETIAS
jgi:subfamily B ATP-binding cassette protein HlyB/CyaB